MAFHLRGLSIACASLGLLAAFGAVAAPSTTTLKAAAVASTDRYGAVAAQPILREGGNTVDAAVATAYEFHLPLAAAVAAPRYHHQLLPADTIFTEPYAPAPQALEQALERLGYRLEQQSFDGDIAAIEIEKASPRVAAGPRGRGVSLIAEP